MHMFKRRYMVPCLVASLCGVAAFAAPGAAEPAEGARVQSLAAPRSGLLLRAQVGGQAAQHAGEQAAAVDLTPPTLTTFDAGTTLNVSKATPLFSVLIKATDDLSGVRDILFLATGPSGQRIFVDTRADYPTTSFVRRVGFTSFYAGRLLQPGVWRIDEARVEDLVGNPGKYNQTALAALGNTTFTVVNTGAYDAVAPTLTSGQILTPTVSLSATAKGTTNQAPFVGVKVTAADTGSTAVAGMAGAAAAFCIAGNNPCLELWASPTGGSQATGTFVVGAQVSAVLGHVPGEYQLYEVVLWDQAGNTRELVSKDYGGTTDFSTLFPTTKITLKP
jgi:hypothetical protein